MPHKPESEKVPVSKGTDRPSGPLKDELPTAALDQVSGGALPGKKKPPT